MFWGDCSIKINRFSYKCTLLCRRERGGSRAAGNTEYGIRGIWKFRWQSWHLFVAPFCWFESGFEYPARMRTHILSHWGLSPNEAIRSVSIGTTSRGCLRASAKFRCATLAAALRELRDSARKNSAITRPVGDDQWHLHAHRRSQSSNGPWLERTSLVESIVLFVAVGRDSVTFVAAGSAVMGSR